MMRPPDNLQMRDMPSTEDPPPGHADTSAGVQVNLPWIVRNGAGIQVMETLSVGVFLTAYAVSLGASNLVIGALAAIPHLSQFAQIPALYLVDRARRRRSVYLWSGAVARPMLLIIGLTAFLPDPRTALLIVAGAFAIRYAAGAFLSCSWNSWMRDLIPDDRMGEVFSSRQKVMTGTGMVLSLAAAGFIDLWHGIGWAAEKYAYTVIYSLAFFGGIYSIWAAKHIHEPPMEAPAEKLNLLRRLIEPFKHANFRRLISFLVSWNFAINLAAPFFTVHMLKRIGLPLTWVVVLATMSQMASYLMVSQWGRVADRFSNKSVLMVCGPLFVTCIFAWMFTMFPERYVLTLPLLILIHVFTGVASAGVSLASGNLTMKLAPRGNATNFLAASSMCNSLAAGSASVLGGLTADFFLERKLSLVLRWHNPSGEHDFTTVDIQQWDFFFMIAVVLGIFALSRLSLIREEGEVDQRVVIGTLASGLRTGTRNLSSIAGLRALTEFPFDILRKTGNRTRRFVGGLLP